jgi:hypothetical protein
MPSTRSSRNCKRSKPKSERGNEGMCPPSRLAEFLSRFSSTDLGFIACVYRANRHAMQEIRKEYARDPQGTRKRSARNTSCPTRPPSRFFLLATDYWLLATALRLLATTVYCCILAFGVVHAVAHLPFSAHQRTPMHTNAHQRTSMHINAHHFFLERTNGLRCDP